MSNQLQKALNLAKKTGDRLLVFDAKDTELAYIVMPISDYEKLVFGHSEVRNLTEDELLDKINRDIAIWKSEQDSVKIESKTLVDDPNFNSDFSQIGRLSEASSGRFGKIKTGRNHWRIPPERKLAAEEIIEEDRQYLEDI
jgi:hypothetical protein